MTTAPAPESSMGRLLRERAWAASHGHMTMLREIDADIVDPAAPPKPEGT